MKEAKASKSWPINPVELTIFMVCSSFFFFSVYRLFTEGPGAHPSILQTERSSDSNDRVPASVTSNSPFQTLEVPCNTASPLETSAGKVRLVVEACSDHPHARLVQVTNPANQFVATVFTETEGKRFSTDYIPLVTGANTLKLELAVAPSKTIQRDLVVHQK